jgi:hypothetical protein
VFPEGALLFAGFWGTAAGVVAIYVALFLLARREVTLRPRRLGWFAVIILGIRVAIMMFGDPLDKPVDIGLVDTVLTGFVVAGAAGLLPCGRVWLFKTEFQTLRNQLQTACSGLFLACAEPLPGHFQFTAKAGTWRLRIIGISKRVQLVVLPRVAGPGKVTLLVQWLSKQYPGPVPSVHIVLKKE